METRELPVVSFMEVHKELEREHSFLKEHRDTSSYVDKGSFLDRMGFSQSIATKLYMGLSNGAELFSRYDRNYNGLYKFIITPQLERICEKYNLFVRPLKFFIGDIPEKNVREMQNFKFLLSDVIKPGRILLGEGKETTLLRFIVSEMTGIIDTSDEDYYINFKVSISEWFDFLYKKASSGIRDWWSGHDGNFFSIAAVEGLFAKSAFTESRARILSKEEGLPKSQVDLDPIVLMRTNDGYIIITAWGDESNDELVANQKMN